MSTPCVCPVAAYCETHKRDMRPFDGIRWRQCREEPGYFEAFQRSAPRASYTPAAEPSLPSLLTQAAHYLAAEVRHTADGRQKAPPELYEARLAVCRGCDAYRPSDKRCSDAGCGCYVEIKGTYLSETCPRAKWPTAE